MIVELVIGALAAATAGGIAFYATRSKKEKVTPEAPYKIEPPEMSEQDCAEDAVEASVEFPSSDTAVSPMTLAEYISTVAEQEQLEPVVEEAATAEEFPQPQPGKKKRRYNKKQKKSAD